MVRLYRNIGHVVEGIFPVFETAVSGQRIISLLGCHLVIAQIAHVLESAGADSVVQKSLQGRLAIFYKALVCICINPHCGECYHNLRTAF